VANCLAISNHLEVALAKFALDHAEDEELKDFAKMLIEDHQAFLKKLERWSPQAASNDFLKEEHQADRDDQPAARDRIQPAGGVNQPAQRGGIQQTAGAQGMGSRPVNLMQLERELAQECLNTAKQMLSSKEGDEFNKCFAGMQFMIHNQMQDKLTVFQRHVSADFAETLSNASMTVDEHMTHAEELMKKWDKSSARVAGEERKEERK
jgi:predicted outer membrane protein